MLKIWKYIVAIWLTLVIIGGFLIHIPSIPILEQTARNLFFHVPMWMAMYAMFLTSCVYSIRYLNAPTMVFDIKAESAARVGMIFGLCGLLTGSLWARFTWGTWWTFSEPKMNLAALAMIIYVAYFVLRSAFEDEEKRAKIAQEIKQLVLPGAMGEVFKVLALSKKQSLKLEGFKELDLTNRL